SSGGKQVVIPCPVSSSAPTRPRRWALAASLALIAMVGLILAQAWPGDFADRGRLVSAPASRTFATDVGEQRSIALADGSVVFLNTNSRAVVRLSASERRIDLMKGEALFEVASDPSRPFRVHAAGTMTQAVGTKFNVRHIGTGIRVVVVEGKVLVDSRPSKAVERGRTVARNAVSGRRPTDQALLTAGQQVEFRANAGTPVVAEADIVTAASWRMRHLSFDDAGLDEIVAEFNRYNRTPIVLADPTLGRIRLSGVFDANDPRSFMAFIELSTSVEVDRTELNRI